MNYLIGEQLGAMIAHFENDLSEDIDDLVTLQKLALASETYKNLSLARMEGIQDAFNKGYTSASRDLLEMKQQRKEQSPREQDPGVDTLNP